ncbi:hypothetical protein A2634_01320 [Candidatus Amesbacteria bacterium RIFCSPHIGHO2_01_FULL_48_32]|uniref:HAD family hydrolase n=1 Tax=Candidatus Amesbacteria bacterium RIFCSPLOWO2_01_FULL_48_25 TaxID=1797259 RepID=A0A1F4ZBN3_9BACT|nr:MAG: hypothetical protein A2634_01320 [Candidatus Amesbacteria bacterium RIFCSPHIGHO2_01_FULL_48_32]OGD03682.1 MAG: hypothetical protein A2989_03305 [Candidatus Amesbacteria bacterium RIFCSPLOWO2_01_FULL_48_25]HJZ05969.1 HAD family hydrolase [Patescibacteria group bacterium]
MIQAVIFDLDGTVLDNESQWEAAFRAGVDSYQSTVVQLVRQPNGWVHEPGIGLERNWLKITEGDVEMARKLAAETKAKYVSSVADNGLGLRDGVVEVVEKVKERGWRTALATSSLWHVVERELEELSLQLAFDVTVTGDEVLLPKPDPEIYTLTAQKLGLEPVECLVIEDAVAGVRSAVEAGCPVVALASDYAPGKLLTAAAGEGKIWVVESMEEVLSLEF